MASSLLSRLRRRLRRTAPSLLRCFRLLPSSLPRVEGRESLVLLSPSEKDEEEDSDDSEDAEDAAARAADAALDAAHGFKAISDDGLLGHDALAALGLLVDCGRRKLVPAP